MEQDRPGRDAAAGEAWDAAWAKAGAGWAANSPQARVEVVFVRNVDINSRILWANHVIP
jgi:hypothetical protein